MDRLAYNIERALQHAQSLRDKARAAEFLPLNNELVAPLVEAKVTVARGCLRADEVAAAILKLADYELWSTKIQTKIQAALDRVEELPPEFLHEGPAREARDLLDDAMRLLIARIADRPF